MTLATVRPIFQNGQRLTAERLMQAFEFLRTMVRRALLAPLSSGVAAGFEFTPSGDVVSSTVAISPGLAIDGKGRLIVVPTAQSFTAVEIAAQAGIATPVDGTIVRICIALDDSSLNLDPCSPHRPLDIEEDHKMLFIAENVGTALFEVLNQFQEPNCVPAWDPLDLPLPGGDDGCCVTLGHVIFLNATQFKTETTFFRQGVSPRFNVIRNTDGTPSIFLNEINLNTGVPGVPQINEPGLGIPVTTLFGPKPVIVLPGAGLTGLGPIGGLDVQATRVAPFLKPYATGSFALSDPRIFEFAGGSGAFTDPPTNGLSELAAGLGGVAAVPCQLLTTFGPVLSAGEPLVIEGSVAGGLVRVMRRPLSGPVAVDSILGISAGPSYLLPADTTKTVVPVAVGGLVKVLVETFGSEVPAGQDLTVGAFQTALVAATNVGQRVVARAAQEIPAGATTPQAIFAWVVHPAVVKGALTGTVVRTQIPTPVSVEADWSVPAMQAYYVQGSPPGDTRLLLAIDDVIDGARIVSVRVTIVGGGGHSALPQFMPTVTLFRNDADGVTAPILNASDTTGSVAAYEQQHDVLLDLAGASIFETVNESTGAWYLLGIIGEHGTDAQPGLKITSVRFTFEVG